ARHVAILAVAVSAAILPAFGDRKLMLVGAILVLVLPFDVMMHVWASWHGGRPPIIMPFVNQLIGATLVLRVPETLLPVLLIPMADIAMAATVFGRRKALLASLFGTIALAVAGRSSGIDDLSLVIVAYAVGSVTTVTCVGALFDG